MKGHPLTALPTDMALPHQPSRRSHHVHTGILLDFPWAPGCLKLLSGFSAPHPVPGLRSRAPVGSCQPCTFFSPGLPTTGCLAPRLRLLPRDKPSFLTASLCAKLPHQGPILALGTAKLSCRMGFQPRAPWHCPYLELRQTFHSIAQSCGLPLQLGVKVEREVGCCIGCGRRYVPCR